MACHITGDWNKEEKNIYASTETFNKNKSLKSFLFFFEEICTKPFGKQRVYLQEEYKIMTNCQ